MKTTVSVLSLISVAIFALSGPAYAIADESYLVSPVSSYSTVRFNNENWETLPHPTIAEFSLRDDGSAYGLTVTGIPFVQFNVPNDLGIRVQRFEIQDHYHYIVDGEIANTLEELSVKLAVAYATHYGA